MIRLKYKTEIFVGLIIIGWGLHQLISASTAEWIGRPVFSPDGEYLFVSFKNGFSENIYKIKRDGTHHLKLTSLKGKNYHPAISPDGTRIVFAHSDTLKYGMPSNLYMMNTDGSGLEKLTQGSYYDNAPIFSKDGSRIYFLRAETFKSYSSFYGANWHNVDIYSIDSDGNNLRAETKLACYSLSPPDISPDGKKILTESPDLQSTANLWMLSIENSDQIDPLRPDFETYLKKEGRKLADKESDYFSGLSQPKFSPDGKSILFVWTTGTSNEKGYFEYDLYNMDRATNQISKLTNLQKSISYPAYSSDGKEIVFVFDPHWPNSGPSELWVMNSDGTNSHKLNVKLT